MTSTSSPKEQVSRVAAYGIVIQEQKILLCRLSKRVPRISGRWTLPGGGVEFGESPKDTVIREVYEETGLAVWPQKLAGVDSFVSENQERMLHSIRIVYHADLTGGEIRFEQDGSTDCCEWFSYTDAVRLPLVNLGELGLQLAYGKGPRRKD